MFEHNIIICVVKNGHPGHNANAILQTYLVFFRSNAKVQETHDGRQPLVVFQSKYNLYTKILIPLVLLLRSSVRKYLCVTGVLYVTHLSHR